MRFIETLVSEDPALVETNATKRMFYKYFFIVTHNVRQAVHPNIRCRAKKTW